MGDRNSRNQRPQSGNQRGGRRGDDQSLSQKPFKQLRTFKVGPSCLACNQTIDLRRQSTGNGYLHSSCEPKKGQGPKLLAEQVGEEDFILVKVAGEEEAVA